MQIRIEIKGLKELQSNLKDFSERRMKAVVATALTRTAKTVSANWQSEINRDIDRPTARTQRATGFTGANAARLEASVFLKDRMQGTAPATYLAPQELGGGRLLKKFEQALVSSGAMPQGYMTVPGRHAELDGYGNVSRGQLVAVIRALGQEYSPGYERVISKSAGKRLAAQARHGRRYVAVSVRESGKHRVKPGIYERMPDGHRKAIFVFKRSVNYKKRLSLMDRAAMAEIGAIAQAEIDRALQESLARLAAKGSSR